MNARHRKYLVAGVDLFALRNHVEEYVVECLRMALEEHAMPELDQETIRDAYAYALNQLPTLYPESDDVGPTDPVRTWDIHGVVENALRYVRANPKQ